MRRLAVYFLAIFILPLCLGSSRSRGPRNIILMIGDGMGVSQITSGHTYKGWLELEAFKHVGLVLTHAHGDDFVTDSAASATAIATGVQTYNGAIGVDPDTVALETVFDRARKKRKKTGLVAVCSITHATPASFVAHVPTRSMQLEIAEQMAAGPTDLILGGGWGWFLPTEKGGRRADGANLIESMQQRGYHYLPTDSAFRATDFDRGGKLLGLFNENHCDIAQKRNPSLKSMTAAALDFLSGSRHGFCLVIEGSQIDWAGHDNDAGQIAIEMADFDDAIGEALRFARKHKDTLIIVTADHETGGFALVGGSPDDHSVSGRFASTGHTATMIPLFATGPGAEEFQGILTISDVGKKLMGLLR